MLTAHQRVADVEAFVRLRRASRYGFTVFASPGGFMAVASGTALLFVTEACHGWMFLKLASVGALVSAHMYYGHVLARLAERDADVPPRMLTGADGAVVVAATAILWLVLEKPVIPAWRPFQVHVTNHDVIHSFWVPRLGGKTDAVHRHVELERIWGTPSGWRSLSTVNHSVVGRRFMVTACVFGLVGGVLAMVIRAQLAGPETAFLEAQAYAQVFTMHGRVMMFLFAIPLIEGFALHMLPKLLGARDLAFPRLSAFGYWCHLFGGSILILALLMGVAPDSGWFMCTPLSSRPFSPGINADVWLIGVTFVEVSAVCAAVEFMATVLKFRAPGMALNRMPILAWYLWVTAAMMLFGFPPLILGSILLDLERAFDWPFLDPARGGDPLLMPTEVAGERNGAHGSS